MAFPDLGKRRWAKREEMACGGYRIVLFGERAQAEENLVAGEVMVGKGCGYGRMPRQECQPPDTVSPTSDDGVPDDTTLTLEPGVCTCGLWSGHRVGRKRKYKRSCSQRWGHTWAKRMHLSIFWEFLSSQAASTHPTLQ